MAGSDALVTPVRRDPLTESALADRDAPDIGAVLGHKFNDERLPSDALTHVSLRASGQASAYQRLEFLGDRVLGLIVAEMLYTAFPDEAEGGLAKRHASLVSRETLADVAGSVGLASHIRIAGQEANQDLLDNPGVLADCCEAVIAALYLDGGLDAARRFVARQWQPLLAADRVPPRDPKTALQEWAQGRGLPLPEYREIDRSGPDHAPNFVVEVSVDGLAPERAEGPSKRVATRAAAERLLSVAEQETGDGA